jgi:hypothetical protein
MNDFNLRIEGLNIKGSDESSKSKKRSEGEIKLNQFKLRPEKLLKLDEGDVHNHIKDSYFSDIE